MPCRLLGRKLRKSDMIPCRRKHLLTGKIRPCFPKNGMDKTHVSFAWNCFSRKKRTKSTRYRGFARLEHTKSGRNVLCPIQGKTGGQKDKSGLSYARNQVGIPGEDARNHIGIRGSATGECARNQVGSPRSSARNGVGTHGPGGPVYSGGPAPGRCGEIGGSP